MEILQWLKGSGTAEPHWSLVVAQGRCPTATAASPVLGTLLQARRYKPPELSKLHMCVTAWLIYRQLRLTGQVQCFRQPDSGQSVFIATLTTLPQMTPFPLS